MNTATAMRALTLSLSPAGHLSCLPDPDATALPEGLHEPIAAAFAAGAGPGLLQLGGACVTAALPPVWAYEVASFYSMFETSPVGRNNVAICTNISCWLNGAEDVVRHCEKKLGVKLGESTAGTLFEKLKNRLTKASAQEALEDLAKEPQDSINQDLVKGQITKALKDQPELVAELQAWLKEAGAEAPGVSQVMNVSGANNKLAQVSGSGNAVHIN